MQHGMIGYVVPLERFADTYNGEPLPLAAPLYLMGVYGGDDESFRERWRATSRKLDMGKSCVRLRRLGDVALDVVAETMAASGVEELIAAHERAHARS